MLNALEATLVNVKPTVIVVKICLGYLLNILLALF